MKSVNAQTISRSILVATASVLASCAMPPKEAWRYIRNDGLIPYIAIEMGKKPAPSAAQPAPNRYIAPSQAPTTVAAAPSQQPATQSDSKAALPRSVVPAAPRLHLNGAPVAKQEVAPKPRPVESAPAKPKTVTPPVVHETPKPTKPQVVTPAPSAPAKPKTEPKVEQPKPKAVEPTKPAAPKTTAPEPAKTPAPAPSAPTPAPKKTEEPKKEALKTAETPPAKADDLPYGSIVPGRPGLVNSPYAGKMQLVDVTGLKPGQEVKCPYTGKLFRVPPGAQAKVEEKK